MRPPHPTNLPSWLNKPAAHRRVISLFILAVPILFGLACELPPFVRWFRGPQSNPQSADAFKPFSAQDCVTPNFPLPDAAQDVIDADGIHCVYRVGGPKSLVYLDLDYWKLAQEAQQDYDNHVAHLEESNYDYRAFVDTPTALYKILVSPNHDSSNPDDDFQAMELYGQGHFVILVWGEVQYTPEADAKGIVQGLMSFAKTVADQHYEAPR